MCVVFMCVSYVCLHVSGCEVCVVCECVLKGLYLCCVCVLCVSMYMCDECLVYGMFVCCVSVCILCVLGVVAAALLLGYKVSCYCDCFSLGLE